MMVYAPDRCWICRAWTSSGGNVPSTRKSLNGCTQDVAVTTTKTAANTGAGASVSLKPDPDASCITMSVLVLTTVAPGSQSAAPGATVSAEAAAPGTVDCAFRAGIFTGCTSFACFMASRSTS